MQFTELNEQFHRPLCAPCPNRNLLDREWHRMSLIRRSSFTFLPRGPPPRSTRTNTSSTSCGGASAGDVEQATRAHTVRTMNAYLDAARQRS
ncbi:hypothetical protein [Qaidamihabitans albus]|uniref:hypothetical protein n=1 Tax=Qaidamihabitans albus TaxID=2795733 RepID=UPI0018F1AFDA|nr:hypothetical protein [Qaidamihabitans albus]